MSLWLNPDLDFDHSRGPASQMLIQARKAVLKDELCWTLKCEMDLEKDAIKRSLVRMALKRANRELIESLNHIAANFMLGQQMASGGYDPPKQYYIDVPDPNLDKARVEPSA